MTADTFDVQHILWTDSADRDACRLVRETVFVAEQNVPIEDEWDAQDDISDHFLVRDSDGRPIATGRLVPPVADEPPRIGRMAVLAPWRGRKVGAALMVALLDRARERNYRSIEMHAQSHAISFYSRFKFVAYGAEFFECEIAHRRMRRDLDASNRDYAEIAPDSSQDVPTQIQSREQAASAVLGVVQGARRLLCIYSRDLDPALFETGEALQAMKQFAIGKRDVEIKILVQDARSALQNCPRLIALTQRLSSSFEVRMPAAEDSRYNSAFVLNDARGYYLQLVADRYAGEAVTGGVSRHRQLTDYFATAWERATPADELRALAL